MHRPQILDVRQMIDEEEETEELGHAETYNEYMPSKCKHKQTFETSYDYCYFIDIYKFTRGWYPFILAQLTMAQLVRTLTCQHSLANNRRYRVQYCVGAK